MQKLRQSSEKKFTDGKPFSQWIISNWLPEDDAL